MKLVKNDDRHIVFAHPEKPDDYRFELDKETRIIAVYNANHYKGIFHREANLADLLFIQTARFGKDFFQLLYMAGENAGIDPVDYDEAQQLRAAIMGIEGSAAEIEVQSTQIYQGRCRSSPGELTHGQFVTPIGTMAVLFCMFFGWSSITQPLQSVPASYFWIPITIISWLIFAYGFFWLSKESWQVGYTQTVTLSPNFITKRQVYRGGNIQYQDYPLNRLKSISIEKSHDAWRKKRVVLSFEGIGMTIEEVDPKLAEKVRDDIRAYIHKDI